jgi:TolA-binding protein
LLLAVSDRPQDLALLATMVRTDTALAPTGISDALERRLSAVATPAYQSAIRQLARGDTTAALQSLRQATLAPNATYFADDALYLLAVLLERHGERDEAVQVANRLVKNFPASIFVNSIARRIASHNSGSTP